MYEYVCGRTKVEFLFLLYDHIIKNKSVRNEVEQLVAPLAPPITVCHLRPETSDPPGALLPQQRSLLFCSLNSQNHRDGGQG